MTKIKLDPTSDSIDEKARFIFELHSIWVMEINNLGIFFNRKAFPDLDENGFAGKVIKILEECEYIANPNKLM